MPLSLSLDLSEFFLALSDRTRLSILQIIGDGESTVGALVRRLSTSQPKVSRHLAYLRSCEVVVTRRAGKEIYYRLNPELSAISRKILVAIFDSNAGPIPDSGENRMTAAALQAENPAHHRKEELDLFLL